MALALVDKKEDDSCRWDDIESYNHASKKLFEAVQEDLENFQTEEYKIIKITKSKLEFRNVICPQIIITFWSDCSNYNVYPLRLEITYQYRTSLMIDKNKEINWQNDEKNSNEIRLRPRIKGIIYHFNFSDEGLLSGYQHANNLQFDSLKNVFISIKNIISNPAIPIDQMYPLNKIENAWENHQDDSCPCQFYEAMPVSWNIYNNSKYKLKQKLVKQLRDNLRKQHIDQYIYQQNKINNTIQRYKPIFPWLWSDDWNYSDILNADFLKIFNDKENGKKLFLQEFIKPEIENRVYSFPFFTEKFCDQLVEELDNYEKTDYLPKERPNSMNNYGVILNYIGLEPFVTNLFDKYLKVIAQWIYPSNIEKNDDELDDEDLDFTFHGTLDHHHTFMVQYKMDADLFLDMHIDDSEVTFNINLLDKFNGAELAICGLTGEKKRRNHLLSYNHHKGKCLIHAGRQRHGARAITDGERQNLIIWCKSSWYRMINPHGSGKCACCKYQKKYKNQNDPDPICLSKTHDQDYQKWVDKYSNQSLYGNKQNNFTIENEFDEKARESQINDVLIEDNHDEGKQDDNPLL